MSRFFCPPPLPLSGPFQLPADAAHHAVRVLRLREGNSVNIFDGLGNECQGVIVELSGKQVIISGITRIDADRESPLNILLAQALTSSEKMDWVIQKATEVGVTEIQPVDTERSVAKLSVDRATKRLEHWQQVAISACEQCGRNILPIIQAPIDIMVWMQQMQETSDTRFILLPQSATSFHAQPRPQGRVILLIGSEGGFAQAECDAALRCGFISIGLGKRVMRTETAAIVGLAALQTLWGDF
jgi:16S rRNA (uracil1498-N3)-methyltransferase